MTKFKRLTCTLHKMSQFYLILLHKYMNCNVKWNGQKIKIEQIKICVIFECEWNSRQLRGENDDWIREMSGGENIQNKRKRSSTLRQEECVFTSVCVRMNGQRMGIEGKELWKW